MYTVKELIEALQQCPEDYTVFMGADCTIFDIESVAINHEEKSVDRSDH